MCDQAIKRGEDFKNHRKQQRVEADPYLQKTVGQEGIRHSTSQLPEEKTPQGQSSHKGREDRTDGKDRGAKQ